MVEVVLIVPQPSQLFSFVIFMLVSFTPLTSSTAFYSFPYSYLLPSLTCTMYKYGEGGDILSSEMSTIVAVDISSELEFMFIL